MSLLNTIDSELPATGKNLMRRYANESITREEFETEIAYWALEHLEDYRHKSIPTPPEDVILYAKKKLEDKRYKVSENFWYQSHIVAWKVQESQIMATNMSNLHWLEFIKKRLKTDEEKQRIDGYLVHFERDFVLGKDFLKKIAFMGRSY